MARTPASCKIGRVLVLLALIWACQPGPKTGTAQPVLERILSSFRQTVQTVRAAVGVRAVPCARRDATAWSGEKHKVIKPSEASCGRVGA